MNLTALGWAGVVGALTVAAFVRPAYGVSLYMFTFYILPSNWWWGQFLPDLRWNLSAGIVLLLAVLLRTGGSALRLQADPSTKRLTTIAIAIALNATVVHVLMAPSWEISLDNYTRLLKFILLFFLIIGAVRTPADLRLVMWSMVLGAAYLGYEVTVNDAGRMIKGRLEYVGAAGVDNSNQLASLLVTVLPLAGGLFFSGTRWDKLLIALTGPLILNVILLCSSRGAFLALIGGAVAFIASTTGPLRKQAFTGLALAGLAVFLLLGDVRIVERFTTTFTSAEERDSSAASRLVYWKAGVRMVADHPLGAGGEGFKRAYATQYLARVGLDANARSVHSGVLNEACEWGLQGLLLRAMFLGFALLLVRRVVRERSAAGQNGDAALGCCLIASAVTFIGSCMFGDYMDDEWGYWIPALIVAYARVHGVAAQAEPDQVRAAARPQAAPVGLPGSAAARSAAYHG